MARGLGADGGWVTPAAADPGITRARADEVAREELAAAGLAVLEIGGRLVVLVPFAQFADNVFARLTAAHAEDVRLAGALAQQQVREQARAARRVVFHAQKVARARRER